MFFNSNSNKNNVNNNNKSLENRNFLGIEKDMLDLLIKLQRKQLSNEKMNKLDERVLFRFRFFVPIEDILNNKIPYKLMRYSQSNIRLFKKINFTYSNSSNDDDRMLVVNQIFDILNYTFKYYLKEFNFLSKILINDLKKIDNFLGNYLDLKIYIRFLFSKRFQRILDKVSFNYLFKRAKYAKRHINFKLLLDNNLEKFHNFTLKLIYGKNFKFKLDNNFLDYRKYQFYSRLKDSLSYRIGRTYGITWDDKIYARDYELEYRYFLKSKKFNFRLERSVKIKRKLLYKHKKNSLSKKGIRLDEYFSENEVVTLKQLSRLYNNVTDPSTEIKFNYVQSVLIVLRKNRLPIDMHHDKFYFFCQYFIKELYKIFIFEYLDFITFQVMYLISNFSLSFFLVFINLLFGGVVNFIDYDNLTFHNDNLMDELCRYWVESPSEQEFPPTDCNQGNGKLLFDLLNDKYFLFYFMIIFLFFSFIFVIQNFEFEFILVILKKEKVRHMVSFNKVDINWIETYQSLSFADKNYIDYSITVFEENKKQLFFDYFLINHSFFELWPLWDNSINYFFF